MLEKLKKLRAEHLFNVHGVVLYEYQEIISDRIIEAVLQNMRITSGATEEDIKKLKVEEIAIEISRQSGKTTVVVLTVEFIMLYFPKIFDRRIYIGIFAPQIEQAKTDFDRLKEALYRSAPLWNITEKSDKEFKEQSNSKTLVLPNGSSCYIFPVTKTSKPESKTLDLIIFEESQDLDDKIIKEQIWPMGANTNAPRVYIGTAGTQICYFYRLGQSGQAHKLYYDDITPQRRAVYLKTGDAKHLIYEQTVNQEIEKHGRESDEIARPYFGRWLIGTGQFVTQEQLEALFVDRGITYQDKKHEVYIGIDTAKTPDSTVAIAIRYNPDIKKKEVISWLELQGDNYKHQFEVLHDYVKNYNTVAIAIDSTGQGDFMPDMFEADTEWFNEKNGLYRVKFTAPTKDMMYKNLKVSIKELLTTLPNLDIKRAAMKSGEKFKMQMLDLQQEYKGQLLSVHHPDDPNAHDDYPDAWALAEWAYARWNEDSQASIVFIDKREEKKRENQTASDWELGDW